MNDGTLLAATRSGRASPSVSAGRVTSVAAYALIAVLAVACLAGVARLVVWSVSEQVSFDGAMNLEIARSLAEGHGYQRLYADRSGFGHEIQSRAPFILPAAAVFATFGVGVWQSQLTNLVYLGALLAIVFALVRRWTSWRWALFALVVCLWTPQIREIAMNGYGEVPALAWWLGAMLVLQNDASTRPYRRWLLVGVLAGMAVLTKTVLTIGLVAMLPLVIVALASDRVNGRSMLLGAFAFLVGIALPGIAYEAAHVAVLGDLHRWHAWLHEELHAIHMQAGTEGGFKDTNQVGEKLVVHARVLAANIGMPLALLPLWIIAPIASVFLARRAFIGARAQAAVIGLALFAAIYFFWWLGFTPTEKAWYRRVFDGVLVLEIVLVVGVAGLWRLFARDARLALPIACAVLIALQIPLVWSNVGADDETDFAPASSLAADLAALARVPADAKLYGVGWYSSPILALYSGRRLDNLATRTPAELASESPVYLVLDSQTMATGAAQYWVDRYAHREIAHSPYLDLVQLDAATPRDPFADAAIDENALRDRVNFHEGEYPYIFGFQSREDDGWRWAMTDAEILLRYGGESTFEADIYLPEIKSYRLKHGVGITVWAGHCRLGEFRQDTSARRTWRLPVSNCPLPIGRRVTVRLMADNVYEGHDDRQLGYIVHSLGFVDPTANVATAQR